MMATDNKETIDDDIYQLSKYVLISNIDSNQDNPIFEMHDIIAETIREISLKKNQQYLEEMISNILIKSLPRGVTKRHMIRTSPTIDENLILMY